MAKILIVMVPFQGHIIPSIALADQLKEAGHTVIYLGTQEISSAVHHTGHDFLEITIGAEEDGKNVKSYDSKFGFSAWKETSQVFENLARSIEQGKIEKTITNLAPDLLLVDSALPTFALLGKKMNIPVVLIGITLPEVVSPRSPPSSSWLIPTQSLKSRILISLEWAKAYFKFLAREFSFKIFSLTSPCSALLRVARYCGYSRKFIKIIPADGSDPDLSIPTIVLCPREFQYTISPVPKHHHYTSPLIYIGTGRINTPLTLLTAQDPRKLIYCALGTRVYRYPMAQEFFKTLLSIVGSRNDWKLVLVTGSQWTPVNTAPSNVEIASKVNQMEVLKHASLMITHGGINSIKEALYNGVPLLVLPQIQDQIGNAARVVHARLGHAIRMDRLSKTELGELIESTMEDPAIRRNVHEMQEVFLRAEGKQLALRFVEQLLKERVP